MPKLVRYGEKFNVLVNSDVKIKETSLQLIFESEAVAEIDDKTYDLSSFNDQLIGIPAGKSEDITVKSSIEKMNFTHELVIKTAVEKLDNVFTFILTDKEFYMPGEHVQFNIFFLNETRQSYHFGTFLVVVMDREGNVIFSKHEGIVTNTDKPKEDVYQYELRIDDSESRGKLNISVFANIGRELILLKSKLIYIDDGFIPNVEIIANSSSSEKTFNLEITAKYMNGFCTKGNLNIPRIKLKNQENAAETLGNLETENFEILDQKNLLEFDIKKVFNITIENSAIYFIQFDMIFEDLHTKEVVIFDYDSVVCGNDCVLIEMLEKSRFLPGLPITFDINVKLLNSQNVPSTMKIVVQMETAQRLMDECSHDSELLKQVEERILLFGTGQVTFETSDCAEKLIFKVDVLNTSRIFEIKTSGSQEYLKLTATESRYEKRKKRQLNNKLIINFFID